MFNYRGATVELVKQHRCRDPAADFKQGLWVVWNTAALTYFDNRFPLDLKLTSMPASRLHYYFLYGAEIDTIFMIPHHDRPRAMLPSGLRLLSIEGSLRFLDEIRGIAQRYRQEHIPLMQSCRIGSGEDRGRSSFQFQLSRRCARSRCLHKENVHAMISVWGLLDPESERTRSGCKARTRAGAHVYDATNPEARHILGPPAGKLLAQGMDASGLIARPEEYWPHMGDAILSSRHLPR